MKHYLLSIYQPAGPAPSPEFLEPITRELGKLNEEMRAAGAWVFAGGLHGPESATVIRTKDGEPLLTDGPFTEGKEVLGGLTLIKAEDLDAALEWGRRLSSVTTLPVEVRPFQDVSD
jgi:hypothetical protein